MSEQSVEIAVTDNVTPALVVEVVPPVVAAPATKVEEEEVTEVAAEMAVDAALETVERKRGRKARTAAEKIEREFDKRKKGEAFWDVDAEATRSHILNHHDSYMTPYILKAMKEGRGVSRSFALSGEPIVRLEYVLQLINMRGGREVMNRGHNNRLFVWSDGELDIGHYLPHYAAFTIRTCSEIFYDYWRAQLEQWTKAIPLKPARPEIHSFIKSGGSIRVVSIGELNDTLIEDNYSEGVVNDYKFICEQFKAREPVGRLALLEGVPGTGKTRLIRAMICALSQNVKCILVSPNVLPDLAGADFLASMIGQRDANRPVILILEDADSCLIKRQESGADMNALSGLLNWSDGILGATLNVRFIATTNAKIEVLDPAIQRPGRLIRRVSMGPLDPARAARVFARMTGKEHVFEADATLAEVYHQASLVGNLEVDKLNVTSIDESEVDDDEDD